MTPEGKVKSAVKKLLDKYKPDCWYFFPAARAYGSKGIPDIVGLYFGFMFSIETKAGKNKPTGMQTLQMNRMKIAGCKIFIINEGNLHELEEWLDDIKRISDFVKTSVDAAIQSRVLRMTHRGSDREN